jgi:hypothetical protein
MGWQDRNYTSGGGSGSDFLGNPLAALNFSLPFGTWFGARVRLHFWLLLIFLFTYVRGIQSGDLLFPTIICLFTLVALLCHEFGHRLLAQWVGGSHNEFMLWPPGGMIPPTAPPFPGPFFLAHVGGIFTNFLLALASIAASFALSHSLRGIPLNPFAFFLGLTPINLAGTRGVELAIILLNLFSTINIAIIFVNFLPYYWFDGGPLLQSILWPFVKLYKAINITCIVGMVLAVPMFFFALMGPNIISMIYWALLFASSYTKRQQLKATGPQELEDAIAWSANYSDAPAPRRKKLKKHALNSARQKHQAEQLEQARIDAILEKVHTHGLHSLSFWEKRTLKKATERQRQRDLANKR